MGGGSLRILLHGGREGRAGEGPGGWRWSREGNEEVMGWKKRKREKGGKDQRGGEKEFVGEGGAGAV